jgi:hypothetical protein
MGDDGKVTALLTPAYGSNLRTWIEGRQPAKLASIVAEQPLRWAERACLIQVASGLALVHARGIVHVDAKLENILVEGQQFQQQLSASVGPPAGPTAFRTACCHLAK